MTGLGVAEQPRDPIATGPLRTFFESYYRLRPVNATFIGVHEHDHRLPDWSPEGLIAIADESRELRDHLLTAAGPSDVAERDRQLAIAFLDVQIAELESRHFQHANPSLALGEAIFGLISLMTRPFAPVAVRVDAAISRLNAVPRFLEDLKRTVADLPHEWRVKCLRECDGADRLLGDGVARWIAVEGIDGVDDPNRSGARLVRAAQAARSAFDGVRGWLTRELPEAKPDRYACGPALFDALLARGHWCERRRADLMTEAKDALEDALARLHERAKHAAPGGWPEVQQRLLDAHATAAEYLGTYQNIWEACRTRSEELDLVTWPAYPIRYVSIPKHTRDAAPFLYYLFYRSPAPFDRLPTHDYAVTPVDTDMPGDEQLRRLRANNISVMKLNHVVHHGAIGHHVQNAYAYAGESEIGQIAAVDCASRIAMFQGGSMAEGWACYATDVMDEAGFLTTDESLAQQHTRARLLARAIVDIGLHERSMTFGEAVALYRDRVGMSPDAARAEACKNSMFPATAIMYWLGTSGLHALRHERQQIEGPAFVLGRFHDRVLRFGSIPVLMLSTVW